MACVRSEYDNGQLRDGVVILRRIQKEGLREEWYENGQLRA